MEIMPSEYHHLELSRNEKIFVRNIISNERFGFFLIKVNPAMLFNESMHVLICSEGIVFLKFFENLTDESSFAEIMPVYISTVFNQTRDIVTNKLISNQSLTSDDGKLKFPVNIVYVFPAFNRDILNKINNYDLQSFSQKHCIFKEDLSKVRSDFDAFIEDCLKNTITECATPQMVIAEENINSILQRIAPEYVTVRVSPIEDSDFKAGADEELLVVTPNDAAVRAFRLDEDQINIVNKISKGEQLILACAGSGKSVLLIAKCFKAAEMNPDKEFLITCYNNKLYSLYTWFIDKAGLRAKNVTCLTFHALCRSLLNKHGFYTAPKAFDTWVVDAIQKLNANIISERYYGIFIDEVQQFDVEWYKFCFNLLENKETTEHLFVICGDKTQKLINLQRHGRAPWNAGEGYPNYRGGNKNIRIEKNYRNCIEVNEYINRYVSYAKHYLNMIQNDAELDPDMFLRGKSVFHGEGVTIKHLKQKSNRAESQIVFESIRDIHDKHNIPYDEIAVIMFNGSYKAKIKGWSDFKYDLETPLVSLLTQKDIPFCQMYSKGETWNSLYGENEGTRLIKLESVLGLDFRAAIICGLLPLGVHDKTKNPGWEKAQTDEDELSEQIKNAQRDIQLLYVACTRAKEILHIILPESGESSVYIKMLEEAE